jgi:hypothetical protein
MQRDAPVAREGGIGAAAWRVSAARQQGVSREKAVSIQKDARYMPDRYCISDAGYPHEPRHHIARP